jgi:hypothetical protein
MEDDDTVTVTEMANYHDGTDDEDDTDPDYDDGRSDATSQSTSMCSNLKVPLPQCRNTVNDVHATGILGLARSLLGVCRVHSHGPMLRLPHRGGGRTFHLGPKWLVIWLRVAGPWLTAALRTGDRPAALSRGTSYWAPGHRFSGSEIENKSHCSGRARYR